MIESDRELSAMVQELWDNDVNRLKPGKDYQISLQVQQTQKQEHTLNIFFLAWLGGHLGIICFKVSRELSFRQ